MIDDNIWKLWNNRTHNPEKANEKKMQESIKLLLEITDLTSCSAYIDLEANQVKIEISAVFRDLPASHGIRGASEGITSVETHSEYDRILTSGITPMERELVEEQLAICEEPLVNRTVASNGPVILHTNSTSPNHQSNRLVECRFQNKEKAPLLGEIGGRKGAMMLNNIRSVK